MITPQHCQEFLESAINPGLAAKNFESISKGDDDLPFILYPNLSRNNTGRLDGPSLRKFNDCQRSSGWTCRTLDPLTGERLEDYIRFKADPGSPLGQCWDKEKKILKISKYRSPVKVTPRLGFLELTQDIIEIVRGRYRKEFSQKNIEHFREKHPEMFDCIELTITPKNFWLFVIENPKISIALAEGEKKAASLLSIGIVAISIPGTRMGYRRTRDGLTLHHDLALFSQQGREITFYFDSDVKPSTCKNTESAIAKTGRLLLKEKCNVSVVTIPLLDGSKGAIDDYLYKFGASKFEELKPKSFVQWEFNLEQKYRITRAPNLIVNTPSMGKAIDASILPLFGLLLLDGAKGTGKTELLENICHGDDISVLSLGHRIFLQKGLSERLGLDYRTDIEVIRYKGTKNYMGSNGDYATRLAGCSEGLIAFYSAVQQYLSSEKRKILVLDEVDQDLISLLTSSTCDTDGNRPVLLSLYEEIIRGSDLIVLASADVSDAEIDWVLKIRNKGNIAVDTPVFYIKNEYVPEGGKYIFVDSKEEVIELAKMALESGENNWFICDTLELSKDVFKVFSELIGESEKGLLINGETSDQLEQEQFIKAIAKQDNPEEVSQFLSPYRFVVVTQSLWTSASITVDHFTEVFACFSAGINGDWDMAQSLERIRKPVPRTIYCVERGKPNKDFSGFYKNQIKESLRLSTEINIRTIANRLTSGIDRIINYQWNWDNSPHIDLYCHYVARENRSKFNLRERLEARLIYEGKEVIHDSFIDPEDLEQLKATAKEERKQETAIKDEDFLFNTHRLNDEQAKELSYKRKLTPEQKRQLELYYFIRFYQLNDYYDQLQLDPNQLEIKDTIRETYHKDNKGRLRESIKRLEYIRADGTEGIDRAIGDDVKSWNRQAKHGKGIFAPDLKRNTSQVSAFCSLLKFQQYLDPDKVWDEESLQPLVELCRGIKRSELSAALGMNIPEKLEGKTGALWLLSKCLERLGIKTKRTRSGREQKTTISIDPAHYSWLEGVLERRAKILSSVPLSDHVVMSPLNIEITGDITTSPNNDPAAATEDKTTEPSPDFHSLAGGMILVDSKTGRPDKVKEQTHFTQWQTEKKAYISRNDLQTEAYRLPSLEDIGRWAREAIREASQVKTRWLFAHFGGDRDCLLARTVAAFPDLADIYNFA